MVNVKSFCKELYRLLRKSLKDNFSNITYKIINIEQDETDNYLVTIQVIGKNLPFNATPESILAQDHLTEKFSQKDVRTLTYLGFSNQNLPKYKVLAKRYLKKEKKIMFALHKREGEEFIAKTADQISNDSEILDSLPQKDAHMIGYTAATEHAQSESLQKELAGTSQKHSAQLAKENYTKRNSE